MLVYKATPNQSLVSGHPPAGYFEKPVYEDYNDIHRKDDVKLRVLSHHKTLWYSRDLGDLKLIALLHMHGESNTLRV